MPYYLCKLVPPRPGFLADMTEQEAAVMQAHAAYWSQLAERGIAIVFGPVLDPAGAWGVGIVEIDGQTAIDDLKAADPAITSGLGFRYESLPMADAVVGKRASSR